MLPASGRASGERRPRLRWTLSDMCAARTAVLLHDADAVPFACTLPALAHTRSDLLSAADKIAFARLPHDGGPGGRRRWAAFVSPEAPPEGAEPVVPLGPTLLCALQQVSTLLRDQIQNPTSGGSY